MLLRRKKTKYETIVKECKSQHAKEIEELQKFHEDQERKYVEEMEEMKEEQEYYVAQMMLLKRKIKEE